MTKIEFLDLSADTMLFQQSQQKTFLRTDQKSTETKFYTGFISKIENLGFDIFDLENPLTKCPKMTSMSTGAFSHTYKLI